MREKFSRSHSVALLLTESTQQRPTVMWDETNFTYTTEFDEILLELFSQDVRDFFLRFIKQNPENPDDTRVYLSYRALESILMVHMTEGPLGITRELRFEKMSDFSDFLTQDLSSNKSLWFKAINRDENGVRAFAPRQPLEGEPVLRTIFDLYISPHEMNIQAWRDTGIRFHLHFRPFLQEFYSEDSGVEEN